MHFLTHLIVLIASVFAGIIAASSASPVSFTGGASVGLSLDSSSYPVSPLLGGTVKLQVFLSGFSQSQYPNGVVVWPFVNHSQWGAFVTCHANNNNNNNKNNNNDDDDDECYILLPLPYAGAASIQLAVFEEGRKWGGHINMSTSSPSVCDETRGCGFVVGQPLADKSQGGEGTLIALSNILSVSVQRQYQHHSNDHQKNSSDNSSNKIHDQLFVPEALRHYRELEQTLFQQLDSLKLEERNKLQTIDTAMSELLSIKSANTRQVCVDWEPWFTRLNARPWDGRPGASAVPLLGYYSSFHPGVIRQHALWLIQAGVTCIEIDWSNNLWGGIPWSARSSGVQELINATSVALAEYHKMRTLEHIPVPKHVIMIGLQNGPPAAPSALQDEANWIWENYITPYGQDSFIKLDNKPLMIVLACGLGKLPNVTISDQFAIRFMSTQLQNNPNLGKEGFWSWMDGSITPVPTTSPTDPGTYEALTITPAYFAGGGWLGPQARGQRRGSTLTQEMAVALDVHPTVLLVCQWNEWAGQPDGFNSSFVDAYNLTFDNDLEPVSLTECGGYQHAHDAGQLPFDCGQGWGFFNLNLLYSNLVSYWQSNTQLVQHQLDILASLGFGFSASFSPSSSLSSSYSPSDSSNAILRISEPIVQSTDGGFDFVTPAHVCGDTMTVKWTLVSIHSDKSEFALTIDNNHGFGTTNQMEQIVSGLSSLLSEGVHTLTVSLNTTVATRTETTATSIHLSRTHFCTPSSSCSEPLEQVKDTMLFSYSPQC